MGMSREEARAEEAYDAIREEIVEEALRNLAWEPVSVYMRQYGDAVEARVSESIERAQGLLVAGFPGPSLVSSGTAIEVIIRYLILRPLVQGAFMSDQWAEILSNRVLAHRAAEDRQLVPHVLKHWNVDIDRARLGCGKPLWHVLHDKIWRARNNHVHRGDPVDDKIASLGIEVARALRGIAVNALASAGVKKMDDVWCWHGTPGNPFA